MQPPHYSKYLHQQGLTLLVRYIEEDDAALTWHETPPRGYLALLMSGRVSQIVPLQDKVDLGRDKSNLVVVSDPKVSRSHAVITWLDDLGAEIKDYGSSNGTYVNNLLIKQATLLQDNDQIRIGDTHFLFTLTKPTPNMVVNKTIALPEVVSLSPPPGSRPVGIPQADAPNVLQNPTAIWAALGCVMLLVVLLMVVLAFLIGTLVV